MVSPDALALVRFGLRAADDSRIVDTVKVIDALLKVETPAGPAWHRYNEDGYGEHADGAPFDGTGIGRLWPLLTGERAHYELAAGRALKRRSACSDRWSASRERAGCFPSRSGTAPDLPSRELWCGHATGSAMPLVWAHAEYIKLRRSLHDRRVFDSPPQAYQRYVVKNTGTPYAAWRFNQRIRSMPEGKSLRIETATPATVHWGTGEWMQVQDTPTRDTGIGMHVADLSTERLPAGSAVTFTFYWPEAERWEGCDFRVVVDRSST